MTSLFIVSIADLFIILLYGACLCYINTYMFPLDTIIQLGASGILAFVLGTLGPTPEDLLEWTLFFVIGICLAALYPQLVQIYETQAVEPKALMEKVVATLPYCYQLLTPWFFTLPMGYIFFKVSRRHTYRHARFF